MHSTLARSNSSGGVGTILASIARFLGEPLPHHGARRHRFADRKEADYADFSVRRFRESGREWDQFSSWSAAQAAQSTTPDEAYFDSAIGARRDRLGYLAADFAFPGQARLGITPYVHSNEGVGDWHAPSYGSSWSPDPIYFRETQYDTERRGVAYRPENEAASAMHCSRSSSGSVPCGRRPSHTG